MNGAVYYPILKLNELVQHEPLGLFCWQLPFGLLGHFPCPSSAAGGCKHEGLHSTTARRGLFAQKKEMCFPCRSSAMGKIFVCTSSFWCHIARDKRSLWGSQRMEMGFEGMQWPSQELTQSAPDITVWRTGRLSWSRELYLPAPCRDKCTILHQIRSC